MQTLYTYPDNFRAYKALIAAKYSGASVKTDPKFVFGETNKSKQFLSKFPFGKVRKCLMCFHKFHHHSVTFAIPFHCTNGDNCFFT